MNLELSRLPSVQLSDCMYYSYEDNYLILKHCKASTMMLWLRESCTCDH